MTSIDNLTINLTNEDTEKIFKEYETALEEYAEYLGFTGETADIFVCQLYNVGRNFYKLGKLDFINQNINKLIKQ